MGVRKVIDDPDQGAPHTYGAVCAIQGKDMASEFSCGLQKQHQWDWGPQG